MKILNFVYFGFKKFGISVFLVSAENGAGVNKKTNITYGITWISVSGSFSFFSLHWILMLQRQPSSPQSPVTASIKSKREKTEPTVAVAALWTNVHHLWTFLTVAILRFVHPARNAEFCDESDLNFTWSSPTPSSPLVGGSPHW